MLLRVDGPAGRAKRRPGRRLSQFGVDERRFQGILFKSLEELLPDDELLLLMQSEQGAEEPDLMAVDAQGRLWIFEMKAGEGNQGNLLQVLRYGQIYGQWDLDQLDRLYREKREDNRPLNEAHASKFGVDLPPEAFNARQVFVTLTNGLDDRTRSAVNYWVDAGLEVRPWLYLVYDVSDGEGTKFDVELTPFRVERDNPYQDLAASYYLLNTNRSNSDRDDAEMIDRGRAAAFLDPWKRKIERLNKGDTVFLYRSGEGIVAYGTASGNPLERSAYHDEPEHAGEAWSMSLNDFRRLDVPVSAADIKAVTERNIVFMQTMAALQDDAGQALLDHIRGRDSMAGR